MTTVKSAQFALKQEFWKLTTTQLYIDQRSWRRPDLPVIRPYSKKVGWWNKLKRKFKK